MQLSSATKSLLFKWFVRLLGTCILMASAAVAAASPTGAGSFASLQRQLTAEGFEADTLQALYARPEVRFETEGLSMYFVHRESNVNYNQYTDKRLIRRARTYLDLHQAAFEAAEETYGVDREVITAIILVETQLGRLVGTRSVLNTLSTLAALADLQVRQQLWEEISQSADLTRSAFDKWADRKSAWAFRELAAFLRHAETEGFDPAAVKGSFAGAMGIAQFMPSNIDSLARDGNNDGRIDLFDDADAIASIAYYLKIHGWKPGIPRQKAQKVIYHYNHSDPYVEAILSIFDLLRG